MKLEEIDLLKLDVEGAEFELLMSEPIQTLQKVKQITVEFHDFMPRFRVGRPYEKCMAKLEQAGFVPIQMAFRTHGDVLLLNKMHFRDSFLRLLMMRLLGRFVKKLGMLS